MCYGNPAKSLEIARARLTHEQWQRFERDFDDFCVVQGLEYNGLVLDWARWAFFQGRQQVEIDCVRDVDGPTITIRFADQLVADHHTRLALAMMDDEQAEQSLERWMGREE